MKKRMMALALALVMALSCVSNWGLVETASAETAADIAGPRLLWENVNDGWATADNWGLPVGSTNGTYHMVFKDSDQVTHDVSLEDCTFTYYDESTGTSGLATLQDLYAGNTPIQFTATSTGFDVKMLTVGSVVIQYTQDGFTDNFTLNSIEAKENESYVYLNYTSCADSDTHVSLKVNGEGQEYWGWQSITPSLEVEAGDTVTVQTLALPEVHDTVRAVLTYPNGAAVEELNENNGYTAEFTVPEDVNVDVTVNLYYSEAQYLYEYAYFDTYVEEGEFQLEYGYNNLIDSESLTTPYESGSEVYADYHVLSFRSGCKETMSLEDQEQVPFNLTDWVDLDYIIVADGTGENRYQVDTDPDSATYGKFGLFKDDGTFTADDEIYFLSDDATGEVDYGVLCVKVPSGTQSTRNMSVIFQYKSPNRLYFDYWNSYEPEQAVLSVSVNDGEPVTIDENSDNFFYAYEGQTVTVQMTKVPGYADMVCLVMENDRGGVVIAELDEENNYTASYPVETGMTFRFYYSEAQYQHDYVVKDDFNTQVNNGNTCWLLNYWTSPYGHLQTSMDVESAEYQGWTRAIVTGSDSSVTFTVNEWETMEYFVVNTDDGFSQYYSIISDGEDVYYGHVCEMEYNSETFLFDIGTVDPEGFSFDADESLLTIDMTRFDSGVTVNLQACFTDSGSSGGDSGATWLPVSEIEGPALVLADDAMENAYTELNMAVDNWYWGYQFLFVTEDGETQVVSQEDIAFYAIDENDERTVYQPMIYWNGSTVENLHWTETGTFCAVYTDPTDGQTYEMPIEVTLPYAGFFTTAERTTDGYIESTADIPGTGFYYITNSNDTFTGVTVTFYGNTGSEILGAAMGDPVSIEDGAYKVYSIQLDSTPFLTESGSLGFEFSYYDAEQNPGSHYTNIRSGLKQLELGMAYTSGAAFRVTVERPDGNGEYILVLQQSCTEADEYSQRQINYMPGDRITIELLDAPDYTKSGYDDDINTIVDKIEYTDSDRVDVSTVERESSSDCFVRVIDTAGMTVYPCYYQPYWSEQFYVYDNNASTDDFNWDADLMLQVRIPEECSDKALSISFSNPVNAYTPVYLMHQAKVLAKAANVTKDEQSGEIISTGAYDSNTVTFTVRLEKGQILNAIQLDASWYELQKLDDGSYSCSIDPTQYNDGVAFTIEATYNDDGSSDVAITADLYQMYTSWHDYSSWADIFFSITTSHEYGEYVYNNDATCTHDGTETKTCADCGDTITETAWYTALGHESMPAVTEDGFEVVYCSRCGMAISMVKISDGGDVNGDGSITSDDAILLLYYVMLPDKYADQVHGELDINGDGAVTEDDALYLLFNTFFPEEYPNTCGGNGLEDLFADGYSIFWDCYFNDDGRFGFVLNSEDEAKYLCCVVYLDDEEQAQYEEICNEVMGDSEAMQSFLEGLTVDHLVEISNEVPSQDTLEAYCGISLQGMMDIGFSPEALSEGSNVVFVTNGDYVLQLTLDQTYESANWDDYTVTSALFSGFDTNLVCQCYYMA